MKFTKEDFRVFGQKVQLSIWLRKYEMDEILHDQEIVQKVRERIKGSPLFAMSDLREILGDKDGT